MLTIFPKYLILDVLLGSEHTSGCILLKSAEFSQINRAKTLVELLISLLTLRSTKNEVFH